MVLIIDETTNFFILFSHFSGSKPLIWALTNKRIFSSSGIICLHFDNKVILKIEADNSCNTTARNKDTIMK